MAAGPSVIFKAAGDGSVHVEGPLTGSAIIPGDDTVDDAKWNAAGTNLAASNQQHYYPIHTNQLGTATADTIWAWTALAAGTVSKISVTNLTACGGSSTVAVDIQKNGVSVLSSVVTLDAATGNAGSGSGTEAGLLDGAQVPLAAGDVLTVVITPNQVGTEALASDIGVAMGVTEAHPA